MKSKRVLAVILVVVALASGVAFITRVLPALQNAEATPQNAFSPLSIEEHTTLIKAESGVDGHHDFRIQNQESKPVSVSLEGKDCHCARLQICLTPDEWHGLTSEELRARTADPALAWSPLDQNGTAFTVPPGGEGLLRLRWTGNKLGDQRFWANLSVSDGENQGYQRVEVPVHLIQPIHLRAANDPSAPEVDVGRLKAGDERTAQFLCFSSTREKFTLTPLREDPRFTYGIPRPLTAEELKDLSVKHERTMLSGYLLTVTVRERVGENRIDIGPFRHPVAWKTDITPRHEMTSHVNGSVLGEVTIAFPDGQPFVELGSIVATNPATVDFTLESKDSQIQLTVDEEKTLEFFKVELLDGKEGKTAEGRKAWRVRLLFKTDSLFRGKLPDSERLGYTPDRASIVFQVARPDQATQPPLRVRVPVHGLVRYSGTVGS